MTYFKVVVDGQAKEQLTAREQVILQNAILHFSAMTNALVVGVGVMLNPPDEGQMGITFAYPEPIDNEKETQIRESIVRKLNSYFTMCELDLAATIK